MRSKYCPMPSAACGKCALVAARAAAKPCGIRKGFSNSGLLTSCRSPTSTNGMSRSSAERPQDRPLGVAGVEPIDLVQRGFDRKPAMAIDGGGSAEIVIALEHQNPVAGAGEQRARGQAAQPRADHDGIEIPRHWRRRRHEARRGRRIAATPGRIRITAPRCNRMFALPGLAQDPTVLIGGGAGRLTCVKRACGKSREAGASDDGAAQLRISADPLQQSVWSNLC